MNSQFRIKGNLLPVPTVEELYELGNVFERNASINWKYELYGTAYTGQTATYNVSSMYDKLSERRRD